MGVLHKSRSDSSSGEVTCLTLLFLPKLEEVLQLSEGTTSSSSTEIVFLGLAMATSNFTALQAFFSDFCLDFSDFFFSLLNSEFLSFNLLMVSLLLSSILYNQ